MLCENNLNLLKQLRLPGAPYNYLGLCNATPTVLIAVALYNQ